MRADEPDVILSDWNMPEMTGIDLLRRLRAEGFTTPLGFVTSEGRPRCASSRTVRVRCSSSRSPSRPRGFREVIEPVLA